MSFILRLNDGTQLEMTQNLSAGRTILDGVETQTITVVIRGCILSDLQILFTDRNRTLVVKQVNMSGMVMVTKTGYTQLMGINYISKESDGDEVYSITLAIPVDINRLRTELMEALASIDESNTKLNSRVENQSKQIIAITSEPDIAEMTLGTAKNYLIGVTQKKLETFLDENPLYSDIHGDKWAYYTVTERKQFDLVSAIARAQLAMQAGLVLSIEWNEHGEDCTSDWTYGELCGLSLQIYEYVKPYVSLQRYYEKKILAAETTDELKRVDIVYSEDRLSLVPH